MKSVNVVFSTDERTVTIKFTPQVVNGVEVLDFTTEANPAFEEIPVTDDDKALVYLADVFLSAVNPDRDVDDTTEPEEVNE